MLENGADLFLFILFYSLPLVPLSRKPSIGFIFADFAGDPSFQPGVKVAVTAGASSSTACRLKNLFQVVQDYHARVSDRSEAFYLRNRDFSSYVRSQSSSSDFGCE